MELNILYSPQQNGVAERMNHAILETVRSILHQANVPLSFSAEAVSTAIYLRNRNPASSLNNVIPYEQCKTKY